MTHFQAILCWNYLVIENFKYMDNDVPVFSKRSNLMRRKPFKDMRLRARIMEVMPFLLKLKKASKSKLKWIICEATKTELAVLESIVIAHLNHDNPILFEKKSSLNKLERSGKLSFIKKYFKTGKISKSSSEAKNFLYKITPILKLFISNILARP